MNTTYISYLRVSTGKQAASGLGLESQQSTIQDFIVKNGGELLQEVIEVESGRKDNRPELLKALSLCRKHNATLLLPKLDRLSRSVSFISRLMDSGIRFVVCDMPTASDFTLHIYSAVAQEERRLISERTKNALAAAKARGVRLGENGRILACNNYAAAIDFAESLRPKIEELRTSGHKTCQSLCDELNRLQIPTFRGNNTSWHIPQVHKLLKRLSY